MTDHTPPTAHQLADIDEKITAYQQHAPTGFACCSAHPVADAAPALLAEVRQLRAELAAVAELLDQQELAARGFEVPLPEWVTVVRAAINRPAAVETGE